MHFEFPKRPLFPTSLLIDGPTSCLREQHIVSLITNTTDRVERSGRIGDEVPRAILITSL